MKEIDLFFQNVLLKSMKFNSAIAVSDQDLLYPDFLAKLKLYIKQYKETYPNYDIRWIVGM